MVSMEDAVLEVGGWDCPAKLPVQQEGNWRIVKASKAAGTYPLHRVIPGKEYMRLLRRGCITVLQEKRGTRWYDWMTDDVLFYLAMKRYAESATRKGRRILVGGLGLGLVLQHLQDSPAERVVVVERQPEVVRMVWDALKADRRIDERFTLVEADFFALPEDVRNEQFDSVITDFWVGSPRDKQLQRLFLRTFDAVNEHWPDSAQYYHGLDPWVRHLHALRFTQHYPGEPEKLRLLDALLEGV